MLLTWSTVGLTEKKSVLDHVYVTDPSMISELKHTKLCFGDHELLTIKFNAQLLEQLTYWRRDWRIFPLCNYMIHYLMLLD